MSCFLALAAFGAEITVQASRDNTLYQDGSGSLSNGAGEHLFVGRTNGGSIRRALLWFDLSEIPAGSQVNSVTLTLHMSKTISGNSLVTIHAANASWGEAGSDPGTREGVGAPAEPGDATWLHRFYDGTFWTSPGGDFDATSLAGATVGGIGSYTWSSTGELVADVQSWVDQPASNFGWIVIGDESTPTTSKRFDSRENTLGANRPTLRVDYTPPVVSGDANGDGTVNVSDVFYLINHIFAGGPPPVGPADANGDGNVTVSDVFYLINFLFAGGPAPN